MRLHLARAGQALRAASSRLPFWRAMLVACAALLLPLAATGIAMSRGIQDIPVGYQECLARAHAAFVAEGYNANPSRGEGFVAGFKANHGSYINCTGLGSGQTSVIIVVASEGVNDGNIPGAERVRLQQRMAQAAPPPPPPPMAGADFTLSMASTTVPPNQPVEVRFSRPAGRGSRDWLGLFRAGAPNNTWVAWDYTHGEVTGMRRFNPLPPGSYEFRFLLDDGVDKVMARLPFVVAAGAPTVQTPLPPPPPPPMQPQPLSPTTQVAPAPGTIFVQGATYGGNCRAPANNVTAHVAQSCNGKASCDYRVDYTVIGDPAVGCQKNYVVQWTCGTGGQVFSASAAPEAGFGSTVRLACSGQTSGPAVPPPQVTVAAGTPLGCFRDPNNPFDLDGFLERSRQNTPQRCVALCASRGFKYAGVQWSESCLCGNSYGKFGPANNCNMACTGDNRQVCGGTNANSVFTTGR